MYTETYLAHYIYDDLDVMLMLILFFHSSTHLSILTLIFIPFHFLYLSSNYLQRRLNLYFHLLMIEKKPT